MKSGKKGVFANLRHDIPSSIVVFLVALPLCLGIALASGAPLFSGIIAGIVGGTIVATISGSPLGVSGPAAGLAVIVLTAIQDLGSFDIFLVAVVLAGVIQLILGVLKSGVIGYYFPSSVIKGMLGGIGIIILLKQIPHAMGDDKDYEGDEAFLQADGENTFTEIALAVQNIESSALMIFAVSMGILILWETKLFRNMSWTKVVPGPLVAVLSGVGLNVLIRNIDSLQLKAQHMVSIPVADSISGFFNQFTMPDFNALSNPDIYIIAGTMAVVASLETLLCVEATDKLDPEKRVTPTNRELIAQGTGNIVSGMIGGLPITQVIVRSSANIQSGGKSKLSAIIHGGLLLVTAMSIPHWLNLIPLASLAAILILVGYKLAKPSFFKQMYRSGMEQFIPFMVTIIGIVFTDLLIGIALGMVVAVFLILRDNYKSPYRFNMEGIKEGKPLRLELSENVSFLNKANILRTLNNVPDNVHVIIDISKSKSIHPDVLEIFEDFKQNAQTRNVEVEIIQPQSNENGNVTKEFNKELNKKLT